MTPAYWGSHWPLSRGKTTGMSIDDRIHFSPAHNSLLTWGTTNRPPAISSGEIQMPDTLGNSRPMTVERWVWLIGMTDASDSRLLEWAREFQPAAFARGRRGDPRHPVLRAGKASLPAARRGQKNRHHDQARLLLRQPGLRASLSARQTRPRSKSTASHCRQTATLGTARPSGLTPVSVSLGKSRSNSSSRAPNGRSRLRARNAFAASTRSFAILTAGSHPRLSLTMSESEPRTLVSGHGARPILCPTQGDESRWVFDGAAIAYGQACAPPKGMSAGGFSTERSSLPFRSDHELAAFLGQPKRKDQVV